MSQLLNDRGRDDQSIVELWEDFDDLAEDEVMDGAAVRNDEVHRVPKISARSRRSSSSISRVYGSRALL